MRTSRTVISMLVLCSVFTVSLSLAKEESDKSEPKAPKPPAAGEAAKLVPGAEADPKATLVKMLRALETANKEIYLSCWETRKEHQALREAMFERGAAWYDFQTAFLKAYGPQSLKKVQHGTYNRPDATSEQAQAHTDVKVKGDKAEAKVALPHEDTPREEDGVGEYELVRMDGLWKLTEFIPPMNDKALDKYIKTSQRCAKAFRAAKGQVGQPGMTADSIGEQLGLAITKAEREGE